MNKELAVEKRRKNILLETPELKKLDICKTSYPYPKDIKKYWKEKPIEYSKDLFPLFRSIYIETTSWCNFSCSFCPSSYLKREKVDMDNSLFEKIILELKQMDYTGKIQLYQSNEPLTDLNLEKKVKFVKDQKMKAQIGIVSNALLLKKERLYNLIEAGIDFIIAEIYTSDSYYNKVKELFVEATNDFQETKNVQVFEDDFKFYDLSGGTKINKRNKVTLVLYKRYKEFGDNNINLTTRLGAISDDNFIKTKNYQHSMCVRPFREFQVTYTGKVLLCCEEWLFEKDSIIGDLNKNTISEIWNGKPLMDYRRKLQKKDRSFSPCDKCEYRGGGNQNQIRYVK